MEQRQWKDEEIIQLIHQGRGEMTDYLMEKYKNLVKRKAKAMYLLGGDTEDLIQEGMIGLFKAIRDYQLEKGYYFSCFAELCISRQMYSAIQAAGRQKHQPLNTYVSLQSVWEKGEDNRELQMIMGAVPQTPEEVVLGKEKLELLAAAIDERLSSMEREVLALHVSGVSYKEMALLLGKKEKSIDNALQRTKGKLADILKK
ncbi:MAG: RNA polymerase sporulation sigma factor SigH [Lachnospiraceae bacterium]|nr:RNA polymerase sporulation sigma factor SigH [Lachnospiraceae bacterium]